ncbi:MAG: hypothetical protein Cons2KO_14720 [Congregibacter sp.]
MFSCVALRSGRLRPFNSTPFIFVWAIAVWLSPVINANAQPAAYSACAACHGSDGGGNSALGAPALAGQQAFYLRRQLAYFRDGLRGAAAGDSYGAQMRPFAQQLDDDATEAIVDFVTTLPAPGIEALPDGDSRAGESLYNGNCGACHGGDARGNEALNAPALASLDAAYVQRQIRNFQSGLRGADPSDRYGRQMAMMANTIADDDALSDILAYIASLPPAAE